MILPEDMKKPDAELEWLYRKFYLNGTGALLLGGEVNIELIKMELPLQLKQELLSILILKLNSQSSKVDLPESSKVLLNQKYEQIFKIFVTHFIPMLYESRP